MRTRTTALVAAGLAVVASAFWAATPDEARAIPAFARQTQASCESCHQGHFPRLNAYGRQFRDNGYQLPEGAIPPEREQPVASQSQRRVLTVLEKVPLSARAQVFGLVPVSPAAQDKSSFEVSVFSFIQGGGAITDDVSFFFTWTPFPQPALHQARIGFHNLGATVLGEGTLNIRAGMLFVLDFQRPGHRDWAPGPNDVTGLRVGENNFNFEDPSPGIHVYGRPGWGPFHYELAVIAGDTGEEGALERDTFKDVFARASWTAFQHSDHEVRVAGWGYVGRSEFETELRSLTLAQRDAFYMVGGDVAVDVGVVSVNGIGYYRHDSDPTLTGGPIAVVAVRGEVAWLITRRIQAAARYDHVWSDDHDGPAGKELVVHGTYILSPNVLLTAAWRQDLDSFNQSSAVLVADVAF